MAWICFHCNSPEAVSYIENETGVSSFPCRFCDGRTGVGTALSAQHATSVCGTPRCGGRVADKFIYGFNGALVEVVRLKCPDCGTDRTGKPHNERIQRIQRKRRLRDAPM